MYVLLIVFAVLALLALLWKRIVEGVALAVVAVVFLVLALRRTEAFSCTGISCPPQYPACTFVPLRTSWRWSADGTTAEQYTTPAALDPSFHYLFRGRFPLTRYCALCNISDAVQQGRWETVLTMFTDPGIQRWIISELTKLLMEQTYIIKDADTPYEVVILGDQPPIDIAISGFTLDPSSACDTGLASSDDAVLLHVPLQIGNLTISNLNFVLRLKDNHAVSFPIADSMTISVRNYPVRLGVVMSLVSETVVIGFAEFGVGYTGTPTIVCPRSVDFANTLQGVLCFTPSSLDTLTFLLEDILYADPLLPVGLKDLGLDDDQINAIQTVFGLYVVQSGCTVSPAMSSSSVVVATPVPRLGATDCHDQIDFYTFTTSMFRTLFSATFFAIQNYPTALIPPPPACAPNQCGVPVFPNEGRFNDCCTTGSDFQHLNLNCLIPVYTVGVPDLWFNLRKYLDVSTGLAFTVPWTLLFGKPGKDASDVDKEFFLGKKALAPPLVRDLDTTVNAYYRDDWCAQSLFKDFACYDAGKCCDASDPNKMAACPCIVPPVFSAPLLYNWYDLSVCGVETTGLDFSNLTLTQILPCGNGLGCAAETQDTYDIFFDSNRPVSMRMKAFLQSKVGDDQLANTNYNMLSYLQPGTKEAYFDVNLSFPKLRVILRNVQLTCSAEKTMKVSTGTVEIPGLLDSLEAIADADPSTNSNYATLLQNMFTVPGEILAETLSMAILIVVLYLLVAVFATALAPFGTIVGAATGAALGILSNLYFLTFAVVVLTTLLTKPANVLVPNFMSSAYIGGKVADLIFGSVVDILQNTMKTTLNGLLDSISIPACFPDSVLVANEMGCLCRNLCARNWANKLAPTGWKNARCGQTYRIARDASGNLLNVDFQSCVVLPDTTSGDPNVKVEYRCMCLEDENGQFAPNDVSSCNNPLYVQVVDNTAPGTSCDRFCQQHVSTALPSWKGSYCLGAYQTSDKTPVPCFLPSTEPLQCMCYKEDALYIPNTTDDFNIYGALPVKVQRMLFSKNGVHIINSINNKYMVNLTDSSGNRVVDGFPLNTQQALLGAVSPETPLQRNLYGERSVWRFGKVALQNIPNLFSLQNVYDGSYLLDPNDILSIDVPTTPIQDILKNTQFKALTLVDEFDSTNYRMVWKVLFQGGAYIFVNAYTNRCILAARPDLIPTLQDPSLLVQSTPAPGSGVGMVGAPGSYLMFDSINEWNLVASQPMPPTQFEANTVQVYNLINLAYQDCLSVLNFSNVVLQQFTMPFGGQEQTFTFPTTNYACGFPYPPINTLPISQLYIEIIGENTYTIRVLTTTQNLCLCEDNGNLQLAIFDPNKKEFQWTILLASNNTDFNVLDKKRIGVKYCNTMNIIRNAASGNYLVHGDEAFTDLQQFLKNLASGIPNFQVHPKSQLTLTQHAFLWTFQKTNPLVNPVNNYRTNIACGATTSSSTPTLCNTSTCDAYTATTNYTGVNILNNNLAGSPRCVAYLDPLLKAYTPGTITDQAEWQAAVDDNIAQGKLPAYTHLTSPCNLYGNTTQYNLISTGASQYNIVNTDNLCLGVNTASNTLSSNPDCTSPETQWNIFPVDKNAGLFTYASDYLFQDRYYFLVCPHPSDNSKYTNGIMTYDENNKTVQLLDNARASLYFSSSTVDRQNSTTFALLQYHKDDSLQENYLMLASSFYTASEKYLACAEPTTVETMDTGCNCDGTQTAGCQCVDVGGGQKQCTMGGTKTLVPAVFSSSPFALEFILIQNNVLGDSHVSGYFVRTKKTYTFGTKQYKGYLYNSGNDPALQFVLWPFSGDKYSYVYNLDKDMQCLYTTSLQRIVWSVNDAAYLSACHSSSNHFIIKNDTHNLCWSMDNSTFGDSGLPSVSLKSCDTLDASNHFLFQNAAFFNPQDFPYITML